MCPTDENEGPDTSFLDAKPDQAMRIPPAPGAERVLRELVSRTGGNVWFVSKAGQRIQGLTRQWFEHNDFHDRSGVPRQKLLFCRRRHEKRGIAEHLRLTHFIDDRMDVLAPMRDVVPHLYLFGVQARPAPAWVTAVRDWAHLEGLLLPGFGKGDEASRDVSGQPHAVV